MERVAAAQFLGDRDQQEDAVRVNRQTTDGENSDLLLLLSDGMGGHSGGEIASNMAVDAFLDHFQDGSTNMRPSGRLRESLEAANAAIANKVEDSPDLKGMGCTMVAVLAAAGRCVWVSVGDSILFLLREGKLRRLNADHSYFGELMEMVERGELTRKEAEAHPKKNALLSVLSGAPIALIDANVIESEPGDILILATDGLETLADEEIASIAQSRRGSGPTGVSNALLEAVTDRKRPKQDNTSVIVMEVPGAGAPNFSENSQWAVEPKSFMEKPMGIVAAAAIGAVVAGSAVAWALWPDSDDPSEGSDPVPEIAVTEEPILDSGPTQISPEEGLPEGEPPVSTADLPEPDPDLPFIEEGEEPPAVVVVIPSTPPLPRPETIESDPADESDPQVENGDE